MPLVGADPVAPNYTRYKAGVLHLVVDVVPLNGDRRKLAKLCKQVRHPTCIPKWYDGQTLLFEWYEAHRTGSIAFAKQGLYGAGDAFHLPLGAPHACAGSPSHCQVHGSPPSPQIPDVAPSPKSPREIASETLALDGTRRKSGSQSGNAAVAQKARRQDAVDRWVLPAALRVKPTLCGCPLAGDASMMTRPPLLLPWRCEWAPAQNSPV